MGVPIYQQIKEKIVVEITKIPTNSAVSSERDLAIEYNASRMTVRKAIGELVDEGYLYRDANRGTFVADKKLHKKNTTLQNEEVEKRIYYEMISFDVQLTFSKEIQEHLDLSPENLVVKMIRLSRIDGRPQAVEEVYIERTSLSDDEFENIKEWKNFNKFIKQGSVTQRFVPTLIPDQYAKMLGMEIKEPVIMLENVIASKNGKPLIYMKIFNNPKEKVIEITF